MRLGFGDGFGAALGGFELAGEFGADLEDVVFLRFAVDDAADKGGGGVKTFFGWEADDEGLVRGHFHSGVEAEACAERSWSSAWIQEERILPVEYLMSTGIWMAARRRGVCPDLWGRR